MSLVTDPRVIVISNSGTGSETDFSDSSVDELVQQMLRGQCGPSREDFPYAQLFSSATGSGSVGGRQGRPPVSSVYTLRRRLPSSGRHLYEGDALEDRRHYTCGKTRGSGGGSVSAGEELSDAAYVERLHRRLMHLKTSADGGRCSSSLRGGSGNRHSNHISGNNAAVGEDKGVPKERKPRRKTDLVAQSRLAAPNAATRAKQQEKYEKRVAREEEERKKPRQPRAVSPVAAEAGRRLYAHAKGLLVSQKQVQEEAEATKAKELAAQCTFKPTITAYRYGGGDDHAEWYRAPEERLREYEEQRERRELRRLDQQAEDLKALTFHPTLSPRSRQIVMERRANSRHRSTSREPFEAAERLYLDGAERLLRQQVRQMRASSALRSGSCSGDATTIARRSPLVRLSSVERDEVTERLERWQIEKELHLQCLRAEEEEKLTKSATTGSTPVAAAVRESGSAAALVERLTNLPRQGTKPAWAQCNDNIHKNVKNSTISGGSSTSRVHQGKSRSANTTPALRRGTSATDCLVRTHSAATSDGVSVSTMTRTESTYFCDAALRSERASVVGTGAIAIESSGTSPSSGGIAPQAAKLKMEMRLIRFGALFYKYTPPCGDTVQLARVKDQARLLYPEDSGLVVALASTFKDEEQYITKQQFIAALVRYEEMHGPQPWGRTGKDCLIAPVSRTGSVGSLGGQVGADSDQKQGRLEQFRGGTSDAVEDGQKMLPSATPPVSARMTRLNSGGLGRIIYPAQPLLSSTSEPTTTTTTTTTRKAVTPRAQQQSEEQPLSTKEKTNARGNKTSRAAENCKSCAVLMGNQEKNLGKKQQQQELELEVAATQFRPALSKRTEELSEINRQRRANYAREMQLRGRELQLLQDGASAPSSTPASTVATTRKQLCAMSKKCGRELSTSCPTKQEEPLHDQPPTTKTPASSIELSSLSASPPQRDTCTAAPSHLDPNNGPEKAARIDVVASSVGSSGAKVQNAVEKAAAELEALLADRPRSTGIFSSQPMYSLGVDSSSDVQRRQKPTRALAGKAHHSVDAKEDERADKVSKASNASVEPLVKDLSPSAELPCVRTEVVSKPISPSPAPASAAATAPATCPPKAPVSRPPNLPQPTPTRNEAEEFDALFEQMRKKHWF